MDINQYKELLIKKNNILKEIYNYTKNVNFKISEEQVERVQFYMKNKAEMVERLSSLENKIKKFNISNNTENTEISSIITENDKLIKEIVELDKEKTEVMKSITNMLKGKIKKTKSTARFNNMYLGTFKDTVGGRLFDSSR